MRTEGGGNVGQVNAHRAGSCGVSRCVCGQSLLKCVEGTGKRVGSGQESRQGHKSKVSAFPRL